MCLLYFFILRVLLKKKKIQAILTERVLWLMAESLWGKKKKIQRCVAPLITVWILHQKMQAGLSSSCYSGPYAWAWIFTQRNDSGGQKLLRPSAPHHFEWHLQTRVSSWYMCWRCDSGLLFTLLMSCYASPKATLGPGAAREHACMAKKIKNKTVTMKN